MRAVSEVSNKLKAMREAAGLSVRDMAAALAMPASTYIHYEARFKRPYLPAEFAEQVATALAANFSRSEVMALAGPDHAANTLPFYEEIAANSVTLVPVYDLSASAGHGSEVGDYEAIAHSLAFPPDYLRRVTKANPAHLAIISVKGDSMTPTLKDDDIVMVDTSKTSLGYDGLFVLRFHEALHVKRISRARPGFVTVISDNRAMYHERDFAEAEVMVVGKVIWAGGKV